MHHQKREEFRRLYKKEKKRREQGVGDYSAVWVNWAEMSIGFPLWEAEPPQRENLPLLTP